MAESAAPVVAAAAEVAAKLRPEDYKLPECRFRVIFFQFIATVSLDGWLLEWRHTCSPACAIVTKPPVIGASRGLIGD